MNDLPESNNELQLDSNKVASYLKHNPEFFHHHVELLENLSIPHPSGSAVSLISKQLELFRSKHKELEDQLTELIEIARENDTSLSRMHQLILALMEAKTLDTAMVNMQKVFQDRFLTDYFSLKIIQNSNNHKPDKLFINKDHISLQLFETQLVHNEIFCGKPGHSQAKFLFDDAATQVKSCAIIPMNYTELEGVIAIGSCDETRFHNHMGNLFLTQLSEVVATRLIDLINET